MLRWVLLLLMLVGAACDGEPPVGAMRVEPDRLRLGHGEVTSVRMHVTALRRLDPPPFVFVYLSDHPRNMPRTFDFQLPTSLDAGESFETVVDLYQSSFSPRLPAGQYELRAGMGDGKGNRMRLEGEEVLERGYHMAAVDVPAERSAPEFIFSSDWTPIEPGLSRQLLAWRWIPARGIIDVRGVQGPGAAWLVLGIDGAESAVRLTTSCSGFDRTVRGAGRHRVEVLVQQDCRLHIEPRGAARLEILAWSAPPP